MGHWYGADTKPQHTVIGANGKERATSLADARKRLLYPSVTSVMSIQEKPALIEWLQTQLLDAAIKDPFHPQEWTADNWKKVMKARMRSVGNAAATRGTEIHNKLDLFFRGAGDYEDVDTPYLLPTIELIAKEFGMDGWKSEQSFADTKNGFAGCVDLYNQEINIIIDFKTKDKENLKGVKQYDDHKIQLAAYQLGLNMSEDTKRYNLFISTHSYSPGECLLVECKEYNRYRDFFLALNKVWQIKNNYFPGESE